MFALFVALCARLLPVQPLLSLLDVNPFPVNSNHIPRSTNPKLILRRYLFIYILFFSCRFQLERQIRRIITPQTDQTKIVHQRLAESIESIQIYWFGPLHHQSFFGFITVDVDRVSHVVIELSKYKCF